MYAPRSAATSKWRDPQMTATYWKLSNEIDQLENIHTSYFPDETIFRWLVIFIDFFRQFDGRHQSPLDHAIVYDSLFSRFLIFNDNILMKMNIEVLIAAKKGAFVSVVAVFGLNCLNSSRIVQMMKEFLTTTDPRVK